MTDGFSVLQHARTGDLQAFRQLVLQQQARVFGIALRLTGRPSDAAELAQDVFVSLHSALARIASPAHLMRWLLRTVSQRTIERLRQHAPESAHDPLAAAPRHRLLQLPPETRAVMLLRYQEDLDPEDIGAVLHMPVTAVKGHLHRALEWASTQAPENSADLEQRLRESLTAPDPGADFTARVMAHVELRWSHRARATFRSNVSATRGRRRSRFILIGTAMMVAGVVAMLALWLPARSQRPMVVAVSAPKPAAASNAPKRVEATTAAQGDTVGETAASQSSRPTVPTDAYGRYTVIAMPLRHDSQDPVARASVDAFYAALLDELRKLPGLVLLIPGVTAPPPDTDRPADYLLTVTSLAATILPSGSVTFRVTDGPEGGSMSPPTSLLSAGSAMSGQQWPVEIRIQPIGQPASGSFTSTLQIGAVSAAQLAAQQGQMLRVKLFPDVLIKQQLMARIRDDSLSALERNRALSDLLGAQLHGGGQGLDLADISVIVEHAALMSPDQRAQLWRSLRGVSHADLVEPLLDYMRRDPDEDVRFEALATLATNHGTEPRVRAAIESMAREDPQQVVRMAARRVLYGDTEWRAYVLKTLKDAGLPYEERLAPLLLAARSAATPAETAGLRAIVNDEETVNLLAGMVRDGWFNPAQAGTTGDALDLLANVGNPATFDVFVEIPQDSSRPGPGTAPAPIPVPRLQISPADMSWLMNHRNDPRVRRILEEIASGNADPQLGARIEQLRQRAPQRRQ